VEQLIEYQKYKKLGELIADETPKWVLAKKNQQPVLPFDHDGDSWEEIAVWDLLKLFSSLVSSLSLEKIVDIHEEVTIKEKIALVYEKLEDGDDMDFTDLVSGGKSVMELICAFLAVLELVRQKVITIYQNKLFGDIRISKCR
jgi:segregation and condensation protein A